MFLKQRSEAQVLASTYEDVLTVTRKKMYIDPVTEESKFEDRVIYQDIPCGLSFSSKSSKKQAEGGEQFHSIENEFLIFTSPTVEMFAGDQATIRTKCGQVYAGKTRKTILYPSGGETPLKVEGFV